MSPYLSYSFSFYKRQPFKAFLAIAGIFLAITVYGAMRLANERVLQSFEKTSSDISGARRLEIIAGNGGIDEKLHTTLRSLPGILSISPRSQRSAKIRIGQQEPQKIKVLGTDILALKGRAHPSTENSEAGLLVELLRGDSGLLSHPGIIEPGQQGWIIVNGETKKLLKLRQAQASAKSGFGAEQTLILDIAVFQQVFSSFGTVDAFDIEISDSSDAEEVKTLIAANLPASAQISENSDIKAQFENLTEAFRLNISFLAAISLLVAILLIYHTTSFTTLKRRKDFATLLSIGASPRSLFRMVVGESMLLGLIGTLFGLAGAYFLGIYTTLSVERTISTLYFNTTVNVGGFPPALITELLIIGVMMAVIGAVLPASEIFSINVRDKQHIQTYEAGFDRVIPALTVTGVATLVFAALSSRTDFLSFALWLGFVPPTFLCLALILLTPVFLQISGAILTRLSRKLLGIEALLALDHILMQKRRNVGVIASIALALGMFFGVAIMITSFRESVSNWLTYVIKADVFISLPSGFSNRKEGFINEQIRRAIAELPAVRHTNTTASLRVDFRGLPVTLTSSEFEALEATNSILIKEPKGKSLSEIVKPSAILISEPFAKKFNLKTGDHIRVGLINGDLSGEISAVYKDYSSEHGAVMVDSGLFTRLTGLEGVQGISLYMNPGYSVRDVADAISAIDPETEYIVRDSNSLRSEVFRIFDQTFQITYALQIISFSIAILVLINALLMLLIERRREFAALRAIGASGESIIKIVSYESLFLSLISVFLASVLGALLSLNLIYVINPHFFGWSTIYAIPQGMLFASMLLALSLSLMIGITIGIQFLKRFHISSLRYE